MAVRVADGARLPAALERIFQPLRPTAPERPFRDPWELEREDIPALPDLGPVRTQGWGHDRRVRAVQHDEPVDGLRVHSRDGPRNASAPVVTDHVRALRVELANEPNDVFRDDRGAVRADPFRLVARAEAAQVRRDDPETPGESWHLISPGA